MAYFGQNGYLQRLKELDVAHNAVTPAPLALPARALADPELVHDEWVTPLKDLDVADARVRNVRVHAVCTVPARAGARTTCDRLQATDMSVWTRRVRVCEEMYLVVSPSSDVVPVLVLAARAKREVAEGFVRGANRGDDRRVLTLYSPDLQHKRGML